MLLFGLLPGTWLLAAASVVWAQHDGHGREGGEQPDTTQVRHGSHSDRAVGILPGFPMARLGSGTSWLPDSSPMHATHVSAGAWDGMIHGAAFLRYYALDVFEAGKRGSSGISAPNWFMAAFGRGFEKSLLMLRGMFSADPLFEGGNGYPLLFQTGETFEGRPLIDRQHPHDLLSEIAVSYGREITSRAGWFVYLGLPGEPALGPVAFMHRPSAEHIPSSPLGHHWQDATHITYGVATLGLRYGMVKIDGSVFTGREPDEDRFDIDRPLFDSYSLRLSANPSSDLSLQASGAYLKSPETLEPDEHLWRTAASVMYNRPLGADRYLVNTLVWGMNWPAGDDHGHGAHDSSQPSLLLESDLTTGAQTFFGRLEWVQKPAVELGASDVAEGLQSIGALTLGTARKLVEVGELQLTAGTLGTIYSTPHRLTSLYGETPVSLELYLRLTPARMSEMISHDG